ncbi:hypothetical protein SUGI_0385990 [Cryptomeria japonica]|nr:hypothetical protein SUGI_0385990 [Cryptomeria japonica]
MAFLNTMSPTNNVAGLGRGATSVTIRSNRGCNKGSFGVEEDKDIADSVHAEDFADKVTLESMGKTRLSYFHQVVYDAVVEAASIFEFVFVFSQLECEKSRIVINMEGQRTTPSVVSYTRNEARPLEEKRSEEDKPTCLSLLQRLCVMGSRRIGPNILLSLQIPTQGGDIKCSGGICTSSIERLLEDKIGQSTAEVVPTVGGG